MWQNVNTFECDAYCFEQIKRIVRENLDKDGRYVIWYSAKRELLIVTVM